MRHKLVQALQVLFTLDDFEGSRSGIDLRFPAISWALASTPRGCHQAI